jgi:hypothetical protein
MGAVGVWIEVSDISARCRGRDVAINVLHCDHGHANAQG